MRKTGQGLYDFREQCNVGSGNVQGWKKERLQLLSKPRIAEFRIQVVSPRLGYGIRVKNCSKAFRQGKTCLKRALWIFTKALQHF